jgi:hypothetical protein
MSATQHENDIQIHQNDGPAFPIHMCNALTKREGIRVVFRGVEWMTEPKDRRTVHSRNDIQKMLKSTR